MMKEGGFGEAFAAFDVIFKKNKKLVTTSAFVGLTTWLVLSSLNHIAERNNPDMVWIVSIYFLRGHSATGACTAVGVPPIRRYPHIYIYTLIYYPPGNGEK